MPESSTQSDEYETSSDVEDKQYWKRLYILVIALHAFVIALFYWLTRIYS